MDEYCDLERRKWNLITFNVPESSKERQTEDRNSFKYLINNIGVDSVEIIDIVHLGVSIYTPNKLHPLRVQVANISHKRFVLVNDGILHQVFSRVYILIPIFL